MMFLKTLLTFITILGSNQVHGASGSKVKLMLRNDLDYYGPLYIGSNYDHVTLVYDTMSNYTAIDLVDATGQQEYSDYDPNDSDTAK